MQSWPKSLRAPLAAAAALSLALVWLVASAPVSAQAGNAIPRETLEREIALSAQEAPTIARLADLKWILRERAKLNFIIKDFSLGDAISPLTPGDKRMVGDILDEARKDLPANWSWEGGNLTLRRSAIRQELPEYGAPPEPVATAEVAKPVEAAPVAQPAEAAPSPMPDAPASRRPSPRPGAASASSAPASSGGLGSFWGVSDTTDDATGQDPGTDASPKPSGAPKPPVVIPIIVPIGCHLWGYMMEPMLDAKGPLAFVPDSLATNASNAVARWSTLGPAPIPKDGWFIAAAASGLPDRETADACAESLEIAGFIGPRSVFMGENLGWAVLLSEPRAMTLRELAPLRETLAQAGFAQAAGTDARLLALAENN